MNGVLMLLFFAVFFFFGGRLEIRPRRMDPEDPLWTRFDDVPSAERFGYVSMFGAGLLLAGAVTGVAEVWLAGPDDPPLGLLVTFVGASGVWSWYYDGLYHRLRRPKPDSRTARRINAVGRTGKRFGPPLLVIGVAVTIAL